MAEGLSLEALRRKADEADQQLVGLTKEAKFRIDEVELVFRDLKDLLNSKIKLVRNDIAAAKEIRDEIVKEAKTNLETCNTLKIEAQRDLDAAFEVINQFKARAGVNVDVDSDALLAKAKLEEQIALEAWQDTSCSVNANTLSALLTAHDNFTRDSKVDNEPHTADSSLSAVKKMFEANSGYHKATKDLPLDDLKASVNAIIQAQKKKDVTKNATSKVAAALRKKKHAETTIADMQASIDDCNGMIHKAREQFDNFQQQCEDKVQAWREKGYHSLDDKVLPIDNNDNENAEAKDKGEPSPLLLDTSSFMENAKHVEAEQSPMKRQAKLFSKAAKTNTMGTQQTKVKGGHASPDRQHRPNKFARTHSAVLAIILLGIAAIVGACLCGKPIGMSSRNDPLSVPNTIEGGRNDSKFLGTAKFLPDENSTPVLVGLEPTNGASQTQENDSSAVDDFENQLPNDRESKASDESDDPVATELEPVDFGSMVEIEVKKNIRPDPKQMQEWIWRLGAANDGSPDSKMKEKLLKENLLQAGFTSSEIEELFDNHNNEAAEKPRIGETNAATNIIEAETNDGGRNDADFLSDAGATAKEVSLDGSVLSVDSGAARRYEQTVTEVEALMKKHRLK